MSSGPWTDEENDLIIADYFAMLADDIAGRKYNKAAHNRELRTRIDRSGSSIEFKHQNISAVLSLLGVTRIIGYQPASNFQNSLGDAVLRELDLHPDVLEQLTSSQPEAGRSDNAQIILGPPPTLSNRQPAKALEQKEHVVRKFDVAGRDERNRKLGHAGEECVFKHERNALENSGRSDLAREVQWVSKVDDGAGYDISSFTPEGKKRLIEVKTTNSGWERAPFYISPNELAVAEERRKEWCLFRLWDFGHEPQAFELYPPLERHVSLTATEFRASFNRAQ